MGLFDRIGKLFKRDSAPTDDGIYLYVRLDQKGEVVRLRLNPGADLNADYERGGFVCRKHVIGPHTLAKADATFHFDDRRRLVDSEINGGAMASVEEWDSWQSSPSQA